MRRYALVSSAVAPVALIGGWTLAAARQPGEFDATRETISALAAQGATDPWVMGAGIAVLGGAHVVTALGLTEARPLGRWVLAAGGVTAVLVAALPQPSSGHFPVATTSFVALAVWPALSGVPGRRTAVVGSLGLLAALGWLGLEIGGGDRLGLAERVVAGAEALWPLAVTATLAVRRRAA